MRKQTSPTPSIRPAEARRRLSVGAPSPAVRVGPRVRASCPGERSARCSRAARRSIWAWVGLILGRRADRALLTRGVAFGLDLSEEKNRLGGASRHPEKSEGSVAFAGTALELALSDDPAARGGVPFDRAGSDLTLLEERGERGGTSFDLSLSEDRCGRGGTSRAPARSWRALPILSWRSPLRPGSRPADPRPLPKIVKNLVPPSTRSCHSQNLK
jgi:hypothetical protein